MYKKLYVSLTIIIMILIILLITKVVITKENKNNTVNTNIITINNNIKSKNVTNSNYIQNNTIIVNKSTNNITSNSIKNNIQGKKAVIKTQYEEEKISYNTKYKHVKGIVQNIGNEKITYLTIKAIRYDKNNNKLDNSTDSLFAELNTNETWEFDISLPEDTYKYKIELEYN